LHIGQYSGGPGEQYQVNGAIAGVSIYNRVLSRRDARELFDSGPDPRDRPAATVEAKVR
jgi:hypothetical protein